MESYQIISSSSSWAPSTLDQRYHPAISGLFTLILDCANLQTKQRQGNRIEDASILEKRLVTGKPQIATLRPTVNPGWAAVLTDILLAIELIPQNANRDRVVDHICCLGSENIHFLRFDFVQISKKAGR